MVYIYTEYYLSFTDTIQSYYSYEIHSLLFNILREAKSNIIYTILVIIYYANVVNVVEK